MVFLLISHIGEYQISFICFWWLILLILLWRLIFKMHQILWGENIHITGDIFLFKCFDEQPPKLLKGKVMSSFGGDIDELFRCEDCLPFGECMFLGELNVYFTVYCYFNGVVTTDITMRECFLYIHIITNSTSINISHLPYIFILT